MPVFGWWEEAGVPREDPCIPGENMQTPHRKALATAGGYIQNKDNKILIKKKNCS